MYARSMKEGETVWQREAKASGVGLVGGLAVSTFSKTLAFLFGLLVFGVQVWPPPLSPGLLRVKADPWSYIRT